MKLLYFLHHLVVIAQEDYLLMVILVVVEELQHCFPPLYLAQILNHPHCPLVMQLTQH